MLRAHYLHPIAILSATISTICCAQDQSKDTQDQSGAKHFHDSRPDLRPFIFKQGTPPPPGPGTPRSPKYFNPDPGRWDQVPDDEAPPPPTIPPKKPAGGAPPPPPGPVDPNKVTFGVDESVTNTSQTFVAPGETPSGPGYKFTPVPFGLALPRKDVQERPVIDERWEYPEYEMGKKGEGLLPYAKPMPDRWMINFPRWQRYQDNSIEAPYQYDTPRLFHPYEQSTLKGDVPIIGEDIFLKLTVEDLALFEFRKLPTPSGLSAATPNESEFFGRGNSFLINNDLSITAVMFKGETAFKPVNWAITVRGDYNQNWIGVQELNQLDPDPRGPDFPSGEDKSQPNTGKIQALSTQSDNLNPQQGIPGNFKSNVNPGDVFNYLAGKLQPLGNASYLQRIDPNSTTPVGQSGKKSNNPKDLGAEDRYTERYRESFALQEAFVEIHFSDLSNNYDFISSRSGIQPFVSDFRGFIFSDTNLGFRVFGNLDNNKLQYNFAYFNMLEKDTFSGLNTFDSRHQNIFIANVYRQDFIWLGYTTQFSFHANFDDGGVHYDREGFLTRPAPIGTVLTNDNSATDKLRGESINTYYLGWAGDGHIGKLNIDHAFYQVFGEDSMNPIAGKRQFINAQMAALELSLDRDWIRFKLSGFYASGDKNPTDNTARGFDSIQDNPFFIGGPFSWYSHQGFNLAGTSVSLKQRDSLVPDLRTSKTEGQSNFVNPGAFIVGLGTDADITPKLKGFLNVNYIWLAETDSVRLALLSNHVSNALGLDASFGFKYRPLLTDNIIISAGVGFFFPGTGYKDIYRKNTEPEPGLGSQDAGKVDDYLYNAFFTVELVY